jgi:hypothetical protein
MRKAIVDQKWAWVVRRREVEQMEWKNGRLEPSKPSLLKIDGVAAALV